MVLLSLGRLNVSHQIMLKINFYRCLFTSENRVLSTAFQSVLLQHCDEMASLVYRYRLSAVQIVYDEFVAHVTGFN